MCSGVRMGRMDEEGTLNLRGAAGECRQISGKYDREMKML